MASASQPLEGSPSQSSQPSSHSSMTHPPSLQEASATRGREVQSLPQAPQEVGLESELSQPVSSRPSQSANPVAQVKRQRDSEHPATITLSMAVQSKPQAPQFCALLGK